MSKIDAGAPVRTDASRPRTRLIPPLAWRRLPWWAELAVIFVGYAAYSRSRIAAPTKERLAFFHASQVWDLERMLHLDIERAMNELVTASGAVADLFGYYYGTLHFIITPVVLVWLFLRRPKAYPRLRSTIIIATGAALAVYWLWPLAPPRFALAGMTDTLVDRTILNAENAQSVGSMVNLYAAMPSLHVAWATWAALAVYATTRGRWRKLVWLYPVLTTVVVMGTANHFLLDAVGGVAVVAIGLYLTRPYPPSPVLATRDTAAQEPIILDRDSDDGTMIDVRRPSAPSPPTDR